jgi:hypothetical protein
MNSKLQRYVDCYRLASCAIVRLIGYCFVIVGAVVFSWYAYLFHKPGSTMQWFGETTSDFWPKVITLTMPLVVIGLGMLLVTAKSDAQKNK